MKRKARFLLEAILLVMVGVALLPSCTRAQDKPRARDIGIPFEGVTGPLNAITDVEGVEVGHTTLISGDGPLVVGQGPERSR